MSLKTTLFTASTLLTAAVFASNALAAESGATTKAMKSKKPTQADKAKADKAKADAAKAEVAATQIPRMTVVDPLKDFGTVAKGEKLSWDFQIRNTGATDLEILSASPACGCTVAEFDKIIKPGATGKVKAVVETVNFNGPISKGVTVQTNDPNTPTATLTIHAVVKPYVEAHPAGFVRFQMIQGGAETQSVTLYSEEEAPFVITSIEPLGEHVRVKHTKLTEAERVPNIGRPGQAQYKVDITYAGVTPGPIAEKLKIVTNSTHQPEYLLTVTGLIRPTYSVMPTPLNFGEVSEGDAAAERIVHLRGNDESTKKDFKVTKIVSSLPLVKAEAKALETPGEFEVVVRLDKAAKPGDLKGNLKIYTTDKVTPVFELPVTATVKAIPPAAAATGAGK